MTKTITGDNVPRTTTFGYDLAGKQNHIGYPDGFQLYYAYYPGTGLLHTANGGDMVQYAALSDYKAWGKPGKMSHGNLTRTEYDYDPESMRLAGITTYDPSDLPANYIQERLYTYTPAGDVETLSDVKDSNTIFYYSYDGLHISVSDLDY
ncbi:MAG: hypothetical protein KJ826_17780 [Proteobacteria bacterium]|nr:hypothetical protein [Pseudomonadota bacterium]MBU4037379.1 hypothetical protein [Pseudomonadota bacterium]